MEFPPLENSELDRLAIFPLPGVVLFPHGNLPLHVFEPRYRELVLDCLKRHEPLAVWQIDAGMPETARGPALRAVGTAGRILAHERLRDGRFNIIVHGIERVRLGAELESTRGYRIVRVERAPLPAPDGRALQAQLHVLREVLRSLMQVLPAEAQFLLGIISDVRDKPDQLSDLLCSVLQEPGSELQRLLESDCIIERLRMVTDRLGLMLLNHGAERTESRDTRH